MEANIRPTIVYMQMIANFHQHLHIYNQATRKEAYSSLSFFTAKYVSGFGRKYSENIELSATGTKSNSKPTT